jgi:hypothetical protein
LEGQQENGSKEGKCPHGWASPGNGRAGAECLRSEESAVLLGLFGHSWYRVPAAK